MVFKSARQRRAFFATGNFARVPMQPSVGDSVAFSYRDGRRLGKFSSLKEVFKKFPSEKKAFDRVVKFRRKTGIQVNTIKEIKSVKRTQKMVKNIKTKRWDR